MKKIFRMGANIGAVITVVVPIATVISCGSSSNKGKLTLESAKEAALVAILDGKGNDYGNLKNTSSVDAVVRIYTAKVNNATTIPTVKAAGDAGKAAVAKEVASEKLREETKESIKTWDDYIDAQSFPDAFKKKAKEAIAWTGRTGVVKLHAFMDATIPAGFTLPSSITLIGSWSFGHTTPPAGFNIPSSVTTIEGFAFAGTHLPEGFTLPVGMKSIDGYSFSGAHIPVGFSIPDSVTSIGDQAFDHISIPSACHWTLGKPIAGSMVVKQTAVKHKI